MRPAWPGRFATTTSSSTCGKSAGSDRSSSARVPVGDDDRRHAHDERLAVDADRQLGRGRPA